MPRWPKDYVKKERKTSGKPGRPAKSEIQPSKTQKLFDLQPLESQLTKEISNIYIEIGTLKDRLGDLESTQPNQTTVTAWMKQFLVSLGLWKLKQ